MGSSNDFKFWEENVPKDSCGDQDDVVTAYSPPLWTKPTNLWRENSPLLPRKRHYTSMSPTSRLRAIVHGRDELTQMIKNTQESSYELSLKDIVNHQQNIEEVQVLQVAKKERVEHKTENNTPQQSENHKCKEILRTESMKREVFLLKLFLPLSLGSNKKSKPRKPSKVCPSNGSETRASQDWWKIISLAVKDKRITRNIRRSTSDITPRGTSMGENTSIPSQKSLSNKKSISRGQKGCLF